MGKQILKIFMLNILVWLLFSTTVAYAEDWKESKPTENKGDWQWNEFSYFVDKRKVTDDDSISKEMSKEKYDKLREYLNKGYVIKYRIKLEYKETNDDGLLGIRFNNQSDYAKYGLSGKQDYYQTVYYSIYNGDADITSNHHKSFESSKEDMARFSSRDNLMIRFRSSGRGDDDMYVKNCYFQFALLDEAPPNIVDIKYYSDYKNLSSQIISSDNIMLSYNGNQNFVYMVVEFDEDVYVNERENNYIETNMTIGDEGIGSFKYVEQSVLPKNKLVFKYEVGYGDYAREVDREGLINKGVLKLVNKNTFLENIESFKIKDKYDNEFDQTFSPNMQYYDNGENCGIRIDGDPPEITEVMYHLSGDHEQYLNTGDILELKIKLGSLRQGEKVSVASDGFLEFNNNTKATIYNRKSDGYGKDDWIVYRYTVKDKDINTNRLAHKITAEPPKDDENQADNAYKNQVKMVIEDLGIRDDFGNVGQMGKSGQDKYKTLPFPPVAYNGNTIFVDTVAPQVIFDSRSFTTYKKEHVFSLKPSEKGSMLDGDGFYYVINKSSDHPTNGSLSSCLGNTFYPYTRIKDVYSDTSKVENVIINDNLYLKADGYTQYDEKYNEINKTGKYENVNYIDGTASDVIYDGRREITGIFYIHTYIEDKAGNRTWNTSQPIYLDNTHVKIKVSPIGTSQYVGNMDINFELLGEEPSGYDKYEYRWVSPLDLDGNILDKKDIYEEDTYTYDTLRDNSSKWIIGDSLNTYSMSNIPIPNYEERQHGESHLLIRAYDKGGNVSYILSEPYYFDKEKPVVNFESLSGGFDKPLDNHEIKVTINDKHSKLTAFNYYFSNSNLTREIDDAIWEQLKLKLPELPEDYDPFSEKDYGDLLTKEAILETNKWDKETLNGYAFLHIYAKDSCGNEIIVKQDIVLDNNGFPIISFDYDNAIDNRYKSIIGHINCRDDGGISTLQYKWSQTKDIPVDYNSIDISGLNNRDLEIDTNQFNEPGEWYLHVKAKDTYGNVTNSVSEKYTINSIAPNIDLFQIDNSSVYISKNKNIAIAINKVVDDKLEYTYVVYSDQACEHEIKRGTFGTTSEIVNIQLDESTSEIQEYYFRFYDSLNLETQGNIKIQAIYDNMTPIAELIYSPSNEGGITSNNVIVTLENISDNFSDKENIIVSEPMYTFTENGEHIFIITDEAGNEKTYVAQVTWIQDDKPIVRVNTSNIYGQSYKSLSFKLSAQRPIESGYVDIEDPEIYYQFSKFEHVENKDFIKYNNGDIISLSEDTGEYYLHTKLVDGARTFTNVYGKYIIDNKINQPQLTYAYEDLEGTEVQCSEDEYNVLTEVNSIVKVKLTFDEDIVIKSVINNEGENLPCADQVLFYNNDTITVSYMDKAGNEGLKVIDIENINSIDKVKISITPNKAINGEVTVVIEAPSNKRINNIRLGDEAIDMTSIITIKADNSEDNYVRAEFTVTENVNIKVDVFDMGNTAPIATQEYAVTNIDKIAPVGNVVITNTDKYTKTAEIKITDKNPTVVTKVEFIKEDASIIQFDTTSNYISEDIIYNNITNKVTTKINGTVKYYFEDSAGNKGQTQKSIDTINPNLNLSIVSATYKVGEIIYNDIESIGVVNKDVEVTINIPEDYYIVNNSGENTRTFIVGMKYDFLISNGINIDKFSIDLTNTIKKFGPKLKLNYTIGGEAYTDKLVNGKTSQNVLLTITSEDDISKVVFDSVEDNEVPFSYEFSENKIINIVATDAIGNTTVLKASIDYIDKEPVRAGLFSLYTEPTKDNIKLQFLATKPVNILEIRKDGNIYTGVVDSEVEKYEFTVNDNGLYSVKYRDNIGNESVVSLEVNNIDREAPIVKLLYNGKETKPLTNEEVMVSVELVDKNQEPGGIKVLNTIGNTNNYLFKENGKFTFRVSDVAGNVTQVIANIDSIDRDPVTYTVSYSETQLTKNDVTVTVTIDEDNYKILNADIDQNNNDNSVNKNVKVIGNKISIRFDDNGYYQLVVSDEAGNKSTILLRVRNIDRIKPTIEFQNDYLVTSKGVMPELNDIIAYDTHDGDIKGKVTISTLDLSTFGDKIVTYTVSDTAGNKVSVERVVKVIEDDYTVVVDGKINPQPYISMTEETDIKVFNFIENATIKYVKGAVKNGEFKQGGQVYSILLDTIDDKKCGIDQEKLSVDKAGWYTIYIMDLNRKATSFTIYFTKTK